MSFRVRNATASDLQEIIDLIQELANYEEMPNGPSLTADDLRKDGGFKERERPLFHSFVAEQVIDETDRPLTR